MIELIQYSDWLKDVKYRIQQSQIKAAVKVNEELLRLYWSLGKDIVEMQKSSHWGDSFLQNLSNDLSKDFPEMKGFSHRNLKSIRQWYLFYSQFDTIGKQAVSQLQNTKRKIISAYYRRNRNGTFKHVNHFQIFVNWKEL